LRRSSAAFHPLPLVIEHHSLELRFRSEVEEQTNLNFGRPQIVEKLSFMSRVNATGGFDLKNHQILNRNVWLEHANDDPAKPDFERLLWRNEQSRLG